MATSRGNIAPISEAAASVWDMMLIKFCQYMRCLAILSGFRTFYMASALILLADKFDIG